MIFQRRLTALPLAASLLLLAGCTASTPESAPPEATATSDPTPTVEAPSATPLVIPPVGTDELSRVVFTENGKDGVPESASTVFASPQPDQQYALEGVCIPIGPVVDVAYRITTTDGADVELQSGTFRCDGTGIQNVSTLATTMPPQLSFTATDGASQAYLRLIPFAG